MGIGYLLNKYLPSKMVKTMVPVYRVLKYSPAYCKYERWFDETDTWDRELLLNYQWKATKRILEHAEKNVPFYQRRWKEEGIKISDITQYEHLTQLPVLTKQDVREYGEQLFARGVNKKTLFCHETGGSTGTPLQLYLDRNTDFARVASLRRWEKYAGRSSTKEKLFYMGRPSYELTKNKKRWGEHGERYYGYYSPFTCRGFLAATNLTDDVMNGYCNLIEKHQVPFLRGYSSGVQLLAEYCVRVGRHLDSIRSVMASSDMVTPLLREMAKKAWNCEVYDRYGMVEETASAAECDEHNGYHIDMVKCLIEIIDENHCQIVGTSGNLIGTCLTNYAMPLIRYQIGDQATLSNRFCPCGIQSMMLSSVDGRCDDIIKTPAGKRLSAGGLNQLGMGIRNIAEYQLVQNKIDKLQVNMVRTDGYQVSDEELFLSRLQNQLDNTISIHMNYVDSIARSQSGKFRLVISNLD